MKKILKKLAIRFAGFVALAFGVLVIYACFSIEAEEAGGLGIAAIFAFIYMVMGGIMLIYGEFPK